MKKIVVVLMLLMGASQMRATREAANVSKQPVSSNVKKVTSPLPAGSATTLAPVQKKELLDTFQKRIADRVETTPLHRFASKSNGADLAKVHYSAGKGLIPGQKNQNLLDTNTLLKKHIITVDKNGYLPLHIAAKNNNEPMIQFIYKQAGQELFGMQLRAFDKSREGNMPIHLAVCNGSMAALKAMLDLDVSILNMRNLAGKTPLCMAVQCAKDAIGMFLIEKYSDLIELRPRSYEGKTPEQYAKPKSEMKKFYINKRVRLIEAYGSAMVAPDIVSSIFQKNGLHDMLKADLGLLREPLNDAGDTIVHMLAGKTAQRMSSNLISKNVAVMAHYFRLMGVMGVEVYAALRNKKNETPIEIARSLKNESFLKAFGGVATSADIVKKAQEVVKKRYDMCAAFAQSADPIFYARKEPKLEVSDSIATEINAIKSNVVNITDQLVLQELYTIFFYFSEIDEKTNFVFTNLLIEIVYPLDKKNKFDSLNQKVNEEQVKSLDYTVENIYTKIGFSSIDAGIAASCDRVRIQMIPLMGNIGHIDREFCSWLQTYYIKQMYDLLHFKFPQQYYGEYIVKIRAQGLVKNLSSAINKIKTDNTFEKQRIALDIGDFCETIKNKLTNKPAALTQRFCETYPWDQGVPLHSFDAIKSALESIVVKKT